MKVKKIIFNILLGITLVGCQSNSKLKSIPPLPSGPHAIGSKENPKARLEYERSLLVDPKTNQIPKNIHTKELQFAKKIKEEQAGLRTKLNDWSLAGPANVGGRTRALASDIENENILIAGGVSGGIWRSTDGGLNWKRASQPSVLNNVSCLVQDPRIGKRKNWYYGTGELDGNSAKASGAPYRGDGIFKSVDNGESWEVIPSTQSNNTGSFDSPFNYIWKVAINPSESFEKDVIYAAIYGNIVRSIDGGSTWENLLGEPNLLESTSNDLNDSDASFYTNLMITPSGKIYAYLSTSTGDGFNGINKGIFYSEDGTTWNNITPSNFNVFSERLVMSYAPSNENIVYFLVEGSQVQLWKWDGNNWSNRSRHIPDDNSEVEAYNSQGSYNMTIKVHPSDANIVFIGGTNLYRSTDGFSSSNNISQIGGYDVVNENALYDDHHPDQHELIFLKDPNQMISSNDGGVFKTFNNRAETVLWNSLNNGYVTSQFYTLAISKDEGRNEILGGLQDNGTYFKSQSGVNTNWSSVLGGDGSYCATTPGSKYWYMSFQEAAIFQIAYEADGSIDTWAQVDPAGIDRDNHLFITPFVLDPNNYNRMYLAGDSSIWRNNNLTQIRPFNQVSTSTNWDVVSSTKGLNENITALDISTFPAHVLFYGSNAGNVYKVEGANANNSQTKLVFSYDGYVSNICIDPSNADRILICYSNYQIQSLFLSNDGGLSFIDVGGNLEENTDGSGNGPSIRWSEIIPLNDGSYQYFVGTSVGLYSTSDLIEKSTVWQQEGINSIGNAVVTMIDYRSSDGKIAVATHGNGVFESFVERAKDISSEAELEESVSVSSGYPNPFKDEFHIQFTLPADGPMLIYITDLSGKIVRTLINNPQYAGDITATWDGTSDNGRLLPNGMYQYVINYEGSIYGGKMILTR